MAEKPRVSAEMRDFPGLATRPDGMDLPPGAAAEQVNVQSVREGMLNTRPGYRLVTFEED